MAPLVVLTFLAFATLIGAQNSTNVTVASVERAFSGAQIVPDGKCSIKKSFNKSY